MEDDSDVPPLEDMSDLIKQVSALKESRESAENASPEQSASLKENGDSAVETRNSPPPKSEDRRAIKQEKPLKKNSSDNSFGGMQKGFLFGNPNKTGKQTASSTAGLTDPKSQAVDDIPLIKPKVSQEDQYRIPEVQNAMAAGQAFLNNKDWVTEDLLTKVSKNESIGSKLGDPKFMQAMAEFQTNPVAATEKYKNNQEVQQFLKDFCGLMGEHFNNLADKQPSTNNVAQPASKVTSVHTKPVDSGADLQVRSSTNPKQATSADEAKMQDILSDPEIKEVLLDPQIQKIIETLRTDPDKVQKALHLANADLRRKINKLVQCGLLQFQS